MIRGCYKFNSYPCISDGGQDAKTSKFITLLGSGAILTEVIQAAQLLARQGISVDVFSVTSWSELARDGQACCQRAQNGVAGESQALVARCLQGSQGHLIAATDYVRAVPESVRAYLPEGRSYVTLCTDGFGRSDTRAALRGFFSVDAASIAQVAKTLLDRAVGKPGY